MVLVVHKELAQPELAVVFLSSALGRLRSVEEVVLLERHPQHQWVVVVEVLLELVPKELVLLL